MADLIEVSKVGELQDGAMKLVTARGHNILLARVGEKYFAADNTCPHMAGNLSRGKLEGTIVTCPRHGSQFDLTDGHNVRWMTGTGFMAAIGKLLKPPRGIAKYPVKIEGGAILIEL